MFKRLLAIAALSVLIVSAKNYGFSVSDPAKAGTASLKPGDYTVKVDGDQVVVTDKGGNRIETAAKLETADRKFEHTSITTIDGDGAKRIVSIEFGGSKYKIVFDANAAPTL
jgi:hypothetical protein